MQRKQRHTPAITVGCDSSQLVAGKGGIQSLESVASKVLNSVGEDSIAARLFFDPALKPYAKTVFAGNLTGAGCLCWDQLLHQTVGHDDACAAVRKPAALAAFVWCAQVVWLGRIELTEQAEQRVPEEVDVRLKENVPLGVGLGHVRFVDHGQVLEAVELEAALRLLHRLALRVRLLVVDVCLEVEVVHFIALGELGQDVDDLTVAQPLLGLADDDEVCDAAGDGVEMRLVDGRLAGGDLEDDLHLVEEVLGEVLAVVELDAVRALLLKRREERLCLGLVHGRLRVWSSPLERVCEEEEDNDQEQDPSWAAGEAARQHVQRCHAEMRCGMLGTGRAAGARGGRAQMAVVTSEGRETGTSDSPSTMCSGGNVDDAVVLGAESRMSAVEVQRVQDWTP